MSRMLLWLQWPVSRPHLHKPAWQPGNPSQHEPHEAAPGPGRPAQADPHYLGCDVIKRTFLDSWFVLKPARVSKVHELNTTFKKQAKTHLLLIRFSLLMLNNCCGNKIEILLHYFSLFGVFTDYFEHFIQGVAKCDQHVSHCSLLWPGCWRQLPGVRTPCVGNTGNTHWSPGTGMWGQGASNTNTAAYQGAALQSWDALHVFQQFFKCEKQCNFR